VEAVAARGDEVIVTLAGSARPLRARSVVVATPAFVTRQIVRGLPAATADALGRIRYGAFLSVAVLTGETGAMPWDHNYAISTPRRAFSVLFNQATTLRSGPTRKPGGSLMQQSDAAIETAFLADLAAEFPESRGIAREIVVRRWEAGAPYSYPGRARLQDALTAPLGRIALAGDYLEFPNMEAAAATGYEAADRIGALLDNDPLRATATPDNTKRPDSALYHPRPKGIAS
jgi:oxygen-dependent protoporphyrinogen oxidase